MKVGIITMPLHRNYGGIMQNYALQQTLLRLGHSPITVNIKIGRVNAKVVISFLKHKLQNLLGIKSSGYYYYTRVIRGPLFSKFVNKHIRTTSPTQEFTREIVERNNCDALVFGSDQVWRRAFFSEENLKNNFGAFLGDSNIPRIAYAASFGISEWGYEPDLKEDCTRLASKFKAISTREDSGVELCKNLGVEDAVGVLDPTLLLTADDYTELCKEIPKKQSKILFAYLLSEEEKDMAIVKMIAKERNLTPVIVNSELHASLSVEEWLAYFRDAEYVVTDSFHGTAFSILFKKDFNVIINRYRGGDRFHSLLNRVDLLDRIIEEEGTVNHKKIDWAKVDEKLDIWRRKSIEFLKNSLTPSKI